MKIVQKKSQASDFNTSSVTVFLKYVKLGGLFNK